MRAPSRIRWECEWGIQVRRSGTGYGDNGARRTHDCGPPFSPHLPRFNRDGAVPRQIWCLVREVALTPKDRGNQIRASSLTVSESSPSLRRIMAPLVSASQLLDFADRIGEGATNGNAMRALMGTWKAHGKGTMQARGVDG